MDAHRIEGFQSEVQLITLVGSTMLLCQEFLGKKNSILLSIEQQHGIKACMEKLLREPRPTVPIIVQGMSDHVKSIWEEHGQLTEADIASLHTDLQTLLTKCIQSGESQPVYRTLKPRIFEALRRALCEIDHSKSVPVHVQLDEIITTLKSEQRFRLVLNFLEDLRSLAAKMSKVTRHHEVVYNHFYRGMLAHARTHS